jgi:hypothetical protein
VRGVPHFHIFFTVPPNEEAHEKLALAWCRITQGTEEQLKFHLEKSWIEWKMTGSGYVLKEYVTKIVQKEVPPEYQNVGRFWGHSKNMQPVPEIVTPEQIAATANNQAVNGIRCGKNGLLSTWDAVSAEKFINRTLRKWQEHQMNRDSNGNRRGTINGIGKATRWKKASFTRQESEMSGTFKIRNGTKILKKLINYMQFNDPDQWSQLASHKARLPF